MLNPIGEIAGFKVFEDPNILPTLKYPTGYKDGNKLGKRKREMMMDMMYVMDSNIFAHPKHIAMMKILPTTHQKFGSEIDRNND